MKTPAIIIATIAGSFVYAAGQQNSTRQAPRLSAPTAIDIDWSENLDPQSGVDMHAERIRKSLRMASGSTATTCGSAIWFDPTPLSFDASCGQPVVSPIGTADVNGDGIEENFESSSIPLIFGGPWVGMADVQIQPLVNNRLKHFEVVVGATGPRSTATSVLSTPDAWASQLWNELGIGSDTDGCVDSWIVGAEPLGWADCDGDGDLDLVLRLTAYHRPRGIVSGVCQEVDPIGYPIDRYHWLRNVGFERASPPIAADLNRDGSVDGVDLGILLASWGAQS